MQRIFLVVLIFICCISVHAQNKNSIAGNIVDSLSKKSIEYATITLTNAKTNKVVSGAVTDTTGYFEITGLMPGTYTVSVDFIGYQKKELKDINILTASKFVSLNSIAMTPSVKMLAEVTVSGRAAIVENKIDKIVYNAENDITSQGGVATDVLKKVPQVSIDADGNVELAGSSGIRFLINGKPSTAFGSNVADVLQSIPASQIKSIEVITNPGAKYDAQGLGGIINIILKKTKVNGINGNVSLNAGTRNENGSFNLTMRKGNFGLNAFVSGNTRLTATTPSHLDRTSIDTALKQYELLHQQSEPRTNRYGMQSGVGFDWSFKKYNSLSGNINYNRFGNKSRGITNQVQQTIPFDSDVVIDGIHSINNSANRFSFSSVDANVNYKRTFAKEDQSLEINVNTSLGNNNSRGNNFQTLMPADSVFYGINNNNAGKENEYEIEIDYTQPFAKNVTFDAGADFTFDDITSTSNVYALQPLSKLYLYDSSVSNYLSYHQQVYAVYAEMNFPVAKLFDVKLGSRYERTEINSNYSNATQPVNTPGYNSLVPSIYILKKLTEKQTLKLSYSKRINRPDYGDLNPFINTTDPQNITAGNPYLKPEIGNRVELSYNHDYGTCRFIHDHCFLSRQQQ